MSPQTWMNWLRQQRRTTPASRQPRNPRFRPRLEALEDRLTPALHQWTGAISELWSNPANWVGGSPVGDANAVLVFPSSAVRFTSLNDVGNLPIQEIDLFGAGYVLGATNAANRIALGSGGIVASNVNGTSTISASFTLAGDRPITVQSATATLNVSGALEGPGGLSKEGLGTLGFTGAVANSFAGTLAVNAGTLRLNKSTTDTAVPGNLVVGSAAGSAGAVFLDSSNQIANAATVTVNRQGVLNLNGKNETLGPVVLNAGSLVNSGTGTTTLSGGVTANSAAVGRLTKSASISGGTVLLGGAGNTFAVSKGPALNDLTVNAVVGGTVAPIKTGAGQMRLSGNNSYTGVTTVSAGVLSIASALALGDVGASNNTVVEAGATLDVALDNTITVNESVNLNGTGVGGNGALQGGGKVAGQITLASNVAIGSTGILAGVMIGPGNLTKKGTGLLTISGVNSYQGTTLIEAGTLSIQNPIALGTNTAGTTVASGAALQLDTSAVLFQEPLTLNGQGVGGLGALHSRATTTATVEGVVTLASNTAIGGGGLLNLANRVTGPGALTILRNTFDSPAITFLGAVANDYAGGTTVNGLLVLNKQAGVNAIPATGTLSVTGEVSVNSPNQIPDAVPITVTSGRLVYSAAETIGPLTLNNGGRVITFDNNNQLTLAGDVNVPTGGSFTGISGNVALGNGPRTFTIAAGVTFPLGGVLVSGAATGNALIKQGAGEMVLQGSVTYTGTTVVNNGTLTLLATLAGPIVVNTGGTLGGVANTGNGNGTPSATALTLAGGTLNPGGAVPLTVDVNGETPQTFNVFEVTGNVVANANSTFQFDLVGLDQLILKGPGTLNLGNAHLVITQPTTSSPPAGSVITIVKDDTSNPATTTRFSDAAGNVLAQGAIITASGSGQRFLLNYEGGDGNDIDLIKLNTAPNVENLRLSSTVIREGQAVTLTGKLTDPDPGDTLVLVINWGDGSPLQTVEPGTAPFSVSHTYRNNLAGQASTVFHVNVVWRDDQGDSNSRTLTVRVNNAPPTLVLGGNATIRLGQTFSRSVSFADVGQLDTHRAVVNFGDGSGAKTLPVQAGKRLTLQHRFQRAGTFRITVTVTDNDGGVGTASFLVTVVA